MLTCWKRAHIHDIIRTMFNLNQWKRRTNKEIRRKRQFYTDINIEQGLISRFSYLFNGGYF